MDARRSSPANRSTTSVDTTAGNALLNEFGNSKDELERFIFALAEYAIAGAPGDRDQALRWAQHLVERSETGDQT